ncbi:response regulator transcription factor [Alcaligenaceae bacterium CGII-47]|nr:response regulator transcription factor [Alcaligenaceae bacterium CGII-47]
MDKCLLVDDLPEGLALMSAVLADVFPDLEQVSASSVNEAKEQISQHDFSLALIDLELGDGNGADLIAWLVDQQYACIPIVGTIFDDDEHLMRALKAGAQGYVLKDQPAELISLQLRGIRDGHPPLSPAIARRLIRHFQKAMPAPGAESSLSEREREVLGLLAKGLRLVDIAQALGISHHTVGDHVKSIYRKLNISSRAEAALEAQRLGLID